MKIYFASDHAGFEMKNVLLPFVKDLGHEVFDLGPTELNPEDDYPLFIEKAALEVYKDPVGSKAIVIGGSGQGEAMVANRFPNVRAIVYYGGNTDIITLSRQHNDANVLSFGARFVSLEEAREAVSSWLQTEFSGDNRHVRRLKEIDELEVQLYKNP